MFFGYISLCKVFKKVIAFKWAAPWIKGSDNCSGTLKKSLRDLQKRSLSDPLKNRWAPPTHPIVSVVAPTHFPCTSISHTTHHPFTTTTLVSVVALPTHLPCMSQHPQPSLVWVAPPTTNPSTTKPPTRRFTLHQRDCMEKKIVGWVRFIVCCLHIWRVPEDLVLFQKLEADKHYMLLSWHLQEFTSCDLHMWSQYCQVLETMPSLGYLTIWSPSRWRHVSFSQTSSCFGTMGASKDSWCNPWVGNTWRGQDNGTEYISMDS